MAKIQIYMKDYKPLIPGADPIYKLRLTYQAMSYFALLNTFQFDWGVYMLLFTFVSVMMILGVIVFWIANLSFSVYKRPPNIRFKQIASVTFTQPSKGAMLASVPAILAAAVNVIIRYLQLFSDVSSDWTVEEVSDAEAKIQARGRQGLIMILMSVSFLQYGSEAITYKPTEEEQEAILERRRIHLENLEREKSRDDSKEDVEIELEDD